MEKLTDGLYSSVSKEELQALLFKQLNNFFLVGKDELSILEKVQPIVLDRLCNCTQGVDNKYFIKNDKPYFSPFHSGQYLIFLYYFANECYRQFGPDFQMCDKLYYLNKILHACDIYYEVTLPEVFFLEHPLGTVLGRASYGNHFFAMQGCTVGGNKSQYPTIGNNVKMYSNSKIIGKSVIGNNVSIAANCYVKDTDVPDNMTVFGVYPNLQIKKI